MTKAEKVVIYKALIAYNRKLENEIYDMITHGENTYMEEYQRELNITRGMVKYWPDIVHSPSGTVTI